MDEPVFCAFVTRGLEDVAAAEIAETIGSAVVTQVRPKLVMVRTTSAGEFRELRTVDDVAVVSANSTSVESLHDLIALATEHADLKNAVDIAHRTNRLDGTFSITVSAAHVAYGPGRVIEETVANAISARYGWRHMTMRRAPLDIRVFADRTWALIGVRLFDHPLSRRAYRVASFRGSLRPTVAAALVRLATQGSNRQRIWDPFCGSATILCEAAELGHEVWGTDHDHEAVGAARENLASVSRESWTRIESADSTSSKTWRRHRSATAVVSNLPWGKQVAIESKQALYGSVSTGVIDLVRRGGSGVLLTTEPQLLVRRLQREGGLSIDERRIGLLGQTPTILVALPRR